MRTVLGFEWFSGRLRRFAEDRSGNMLMLFSLSAPVVIGLAAMGSEGGSLYLKKAAMQAAADQAAVSAANAFNSSGTAYTIEGKGVAAAMGYVDGQNGVTVTVNSPPATGPNSGNLGAVEVIVSTTQPPMLSALFHRSNYVINARATATYGGSGCVLALDPTAPEAIWVQGSSIVDMPKCDMVANSDASNALTVAGSASATVDGVAVVGGISATSGLVDNRNETGAPPTPNPYNLSVPSPSGSTQTVPSGSVVTLNPGVYDGLQFNAGQTVTLNPGVYVIDQGQLDFEGGSVTGTGVTFVLTSSSTTTAKINGNASFNITAPTSGAFAGVVVFQPTNTNGTLKLNGNANTYFGGAIVAPSAPIQFAGTGVSGTGHDCTQIVSDTVTFTGNARIDSNCSGYGAGSFGKQTMLSE